MFTIEDLRAGRCAVHNDGTLEELTEVLHSAFPNDKTFSTGGSNFYVTTWVGCMEVDVPTQSVKDFLKKPADESELRRGDLVYVSNQDRNKKGATRVFLTKIKGAVAPFIVVNKNSVEDYYNGRPFMISNCIFATKVEEYKEPSETVMTIEEIEKALGIQNLKVVK